MPAFTRKACGLSMPLILKMGFRLYVSISGFDWFTWFKVILFIVLKNQLKLTIYQLYCTL
jgi:hypothetical protein